MLGEGRIGIDAAQIRGSQIIGSASAAHMADDDEVDAETLEAGATGPRRLHVPAALAGERLDKALALLMPDVSRSRIQQWIEAGAVRVDGRARRARDPVAPAAAIEVTPPPAPESSALLPEAMPLAILHEDADLIVLDKPPGLVVHPGAGNWSGTLLNGLLAHDRVLAQLPRAGIVHRLDAHTSGLMVVARSLAAHVDLVRQLQERTVTREYWAVVHGRAASGGTIDAALARDPRNPLRFRVSRAATARSARTHWRCIAHAAAASWIACRLDTGRTHQIRVHLESIGHPLVGDPVYRRGAPPVLPDARGWMRFARQALHACRLAFLHPRSGAPLSFFRAPPPDMRALMRELGFKRTTRPSEVFA
jgi:23S rRNA pseudouridine1911/1915/1917 synthase